MVPLSPPTVRLPVVQVPVQLPAVQVGTAKAPQVPLTETGALHEAFVPPLLPVQVQVPAEALYAAAVPAEQVSAVLLHTPLTALPQTPVYFSHTYSFVLQMELSVGA
jgi:hypothetical protein